jgi:hypothetical protein
MRKVLFFVASLLAVTGCATKTSTCNLSTASSNPSISLPPSFAFEPIAAIGDAQWQKAMSGYGDILAKHNVRQVIFVHGTFVGNDPFGISKLFKHLPDSLDMTDFRNHTKATMDKLTGDEGNYTEKYVGKFCTAVSNKLCSNNNRVTWSSGNTHEDRLRGAIKLAEHIAKTINAGKVRANETILLLGHSHAGQLFALLTHFLEDGKMANQLYKFINIHDGPQSESQLKTDIDTIKSVNLDFVTFGTPVRYTWGRYKKFRLMPVINHRNNSELSGVPTIRDGDYVQQWGVDGTDALTLSKPSIEKELSEILNSPGLDLAALLKSLKDNSRSLPKYEDCTVVHENVLVNYWDNLQSPDVVVGQQRLFGHAVYTTEQTMLFNVGLIVQSLYSP